PDEDQEVPIRDLEGEIVQRGGAFGEPLRDVLQPHLGHRYPLSPGVAILRTKYRWATKKSRTTGSMLITCAAISRFVSGWRAPGTFGRSSAPSVSIRWKRRTIRNVGMMTTWNGTISVARIRMNATSRPKNLIRANAYPARLQNSRLPATHASVTSRVLTNHRAN